MLKPQTPTPTPIPLPDGVTADVRWTARGGWTAVLMGAAGRFTVRRVAKEIQVSDAAGTVLMRLVYSPRDLGNFDAACLYAADRASGVDPFARRTESRS